jgi:hypothetical protein
MTELLCGAGGVPVGKLVVEVVHGRDDATGAVLAGHATPAGRKVSFMANWPWNIDR